MSAIPADIDLIATDIVRAQYTDADDAEWEEYKAIANALVAERKRCAEVARSREGTARKLAADQTDGDRALYHHMAADMALDIAEAIEKARP